MREPRANTAGSDTKTVPLRGHCSSYSTALRARSNHESFGRPSRNALAGGEGLVDPPSCDLSDTVSKRMSAPGSRGGKSNRMRSSNCSHGPIMLTTAGQLEIGVPHENEAISVAASPPAQSSVG